LDKYKQTTTGPHKVFYCKEKEQDLHGTGALRYIRAMEKVPATEKKQTKKKQTIKDALKAQCSSGGTWYMPKAQLHRANVWLRKGMGGVYSPFIFETPAALDQRCNYFLPLENLDWRVVAAALTSTLFGLAAESSGNASMGDGVLELATTMLQRLRVVDVRGIKDAKAKKDLISLAEKVWTDTVPTNWNIAERPPNELEDLDRWFLSQMTTKVTVDRLYADLAATIASRRLLASDKEAQTKKGEQVNIATVARGIADSVLPVLESQSFPESFVDVGASTQALDFSHAGKLELECHPMMDQALLVVRDGQADALMEGQYPRSVAQVIVKALLMGRKKFSYPTQIRDAEVALKGFASWYPKILTKIAAGCGMSAVGTSYEGAVNKAVLEMLHLNEHLSSTDFYGDLRIAK